MPGARPRTPKDAATKDAADAARSYGALFPAVYLRFHRRDGVRRELSGASRAVLLHLAQTGPMTIGECARHLDRAQSFMGTMPAWKDHPRVVAARRGE